VRTGNRRRNSACTPEALDRMAAAYAAKMQRVRDEVAMCQRVAAAEQIEWTDEELRELLEIGRKSDDE